MTSPPVGSRSPRRRGRRRPGRGARAGSRPGRRERGMYCGTETTNAPDSIAMWRTVASQPSLSSAVGATISAGPGGRRPSARAACGSPSTPARRCAQRGVRHGEVVAGAEGVEQALLMGRHQLAVLQLDAVGAEQQQRVVERAGPLALALVDADRDVHAVCPAGSTRRSTSGPGTSTEFSHRRSHSRRTRETGRLARPCVRRIEGTNVSGSTASCPPSRAASPISETPCRHKPRRRE